MSFLGDGSQRRIRLLRPLFDNTLCLQFSRVWTGASDRRGLIKTIAPGPARITCDFHKSLLIQAVTDRTRCNLPYYSRTVSVLQTAKLGFIIPVIALVIWRISSVEGHPSPGSVT